MPARSSNPCVCPPPPFPRTRAVNMGHGTVEIKTRSTRWLDRNFSCQAGFEFFDYTRSPSRKLRLSGRVACVCLPWAGSPASCGLPVLGRWGTNEPTERGAIDQVSRKGQQRGREAAYGRAEDRSAQQRRQQTFRDPTEESRPEHALQDRGARHRVECHVQIPQGKEHTPAHEMQQQAQGTGEVSQGRELQGVARHQGGHRIHEQDLSQCAEQAAEQRFDDHMLLHIFHPPCEPCASPATFPPQTRSTPSVPTTRPVWAWRCGAIARGVLRPLPAPAVTICRHLSPHVVTVCRGGPCRRPPSQPVACRAGREGTPQGGRASGRVSRWHGKC